MKTDGQVKSDERDNNRVLRWIIFAIAVLLAASLSYSFFAGQKIAEEHSESRVVNMASQAHLSNYRFPIAALRSSTAAGFGTCALNPT